MEIIKNKYRCLLIDEFQDTDPIQPELMFLITGQDVYEKQWHKLVPSPSSLFVVGDPKQSRGIFFGISDRAIAEYKLSGGIFKIYAEVPESLQEDIKALFETAFNKLSMYLKWSRDYHPVTVFEKTAADIGLVPLTLAGTEAQTGCRYITKILEMLRQNTTEDYSDFNSLIGLLDAIFDADLEEELDITWQEQDAVRIMNQGLNSNKLLNKSNKTSP